jgi:hypothetical protein
MSERIEKQALRQYLSHYLPLGVFQVRVKIDTYHISCDKIRDIVINSKILNVL